MTSEIFLPDVAATETLASQLVAALPDPPAGWLLLFEGELGSGKSTLARAMLRKYGYAGTIPSPTYTLIEPYTFPGWWAYHIDLYRINDKEELDYLGWADLEDGLRLVEWPERVPELAKAADLRIGLSYEGAGRKAALLASSERGAEAVRCLEAVYASDPS